MLDNDERQKGEEEAGEYIMEKLKGWMEKIVRMNREQKKVFWLMVFMVVINIMILAVAVMIFKSLMDKL